jgi:hypothetical protein
MASDSGHSNENDTRKDEATEQDAAPSDTSATKEPAAAPTPTGATPASAKHPSGASRPRTAGPKGKRAAPRKAGFSIRNVLLFGALVVLFLAAFGMLGTKDNGGPANAPRWKLNEPVDIELTLVASDANDLACAMEGELAGLHCGYTAPNAKNAAAQGSREDAKLLQPYSTTSRQNLLAANVWMQPELKDAAALDAKIKTMQNSRFSVSCKFTPRGRAKGAKVQWKPGTDWGPGDTWYVGEVKDCKLAK